MSYCNQKRENTILDSRLRGNDRKSRNVSLRIILLFAIGFLSLAGGLVVHAASGPELFITWHADTYTPPGFDGKALPIAKSKLTVSFELIDNERLVDVSQQTVYWYVNDDFLTGGSGIQEISIHAPEIGSTGLSVRVQLPNYQTNALTVKTITIPVVFPKAVIGSSYPNQIVPRDKATLAALPYFFNVSDPSRLVISWNVNDVVPQNQDDPQFLTLNLGNTSRGSSLNVNLSVSNPSGVFEANETTSVFTVQ